MPSRSTKTAARKPLDIREIGLGRYEAIVPIGEHQRLAVRLHDVDHDLTSVQYFNRPYPAEYRLAREMPAQIAALPRLDPHIVTATFGPQITRRSVVHYAYFASLRGHLGQRFAAAALMKQRWPTNNENLSQRRMALELL